MSRLHLPHGHPTLHLAPHRRVPASRCGRADSGADAESGCQRGRLETTPTSTSSGTGVTTRAGRGSTARTARPRPRRRRGRSSRQIVVTATCKDVAGNTGSASYTLKVDKTKPAAAPTQTPAANADGWNNTDVNVAWNWSDNAGGSGIDSANCTTASTSSGEGASIVVTATCKDRAGNTGSASYTVKVDKTKPTAAPTQSPAANGTVGTRPTSTSPGTGVTTRAGRGSTARTARPRPRRRARARRSS